MKKIVCIILCFILLCGAASAETFLDVARDYINDLYGEEVLATDVSAEEAFSEWEYDEDSKDVGVFLLKYRESLVSDDMTGMTILNTDGLFIPSGIILYNSSTKKSYYIDKLVDRLNFLTISTILKAPETYSGEAFTVYYSFEKEDISSAVALTCTRKGTTYGVSTDKGFIQLTAARWFTIVSQWTDGFMYGYYDD